MQQLLRLNICEQDIRISVGMRVPSFLLSGWCVPFGFVSLGCHDRRSDRYNLVLDTQGLGCDDRRADRDNPRLGCHDRRAPIVTT